MEKLWNIAAWPLLTLFEYMRDRRWNPPAVATAACVRAPRAIRRHDGTGRTWPVESSRLDALLQLRCSHVRAGRPCTHAAEPPSPSDALAAYGPQCGHHTEAGAPYRWVPAGWRPATGERALAARLDDTHAISARQIADAFASTR